jgi:all-trans-retinol 13,14-reductase
MMLFSLLLFFFSYFLFHLTFYKNKIHTTSIIQGKYHKIDQDKFHVSKITNSENGDNKIEVDIVIIGSGIAGLTCASLLSQLGYKVLVLEQHYIAGGTLHFFEQKGEETYKFETGIHYVGKLSKFNEKLFNLISGSDIDMKPMDDVFDIIIADNNKYSIPKSYRNYTNMLISHFPDEKENILKYVSLIRKTASKGSLFFIFKLFPKIITKYLNKFFIDFTYIDKSISDVIDSITNNKDLKNVLIGQFADYGSSPETCPFQFASQVLNHYISDGAYYPVDNIAKNIILNIEKYGNRVLTGRKVKEIIIENNKVSGVEMDNGIVINCNKIISACGVLTTFNKLISINSPYIDKMRQISNRLDGDVEFIFLFVGLKSKHTVSNNTWYHTDIPLFISRRKDQNTMIILTLAKYEWFEKWKDEVHKHRSEEYEELKNKFKDIMLSHTLKIYPELKDQIEFVNVATPLSYEYYFNSSKCYGLKMNSERYHTLELRSTTEIDGLYLTGQDTTVLGLTGAMAAGLLTTINVVNLKNKMKLIKKILI